MDEREMMQKENSFRLQSAIMRAGVSITNMVVEMSKKHLELGRMTKAASILVEVGFSSPGVFGVLEEECIRQQHSDGGWVSIVDTMWNVFFLSRQDSMKHADRIMAAEKYLVLNQGAHHIWGRSIRDFERIPVSGTLLFLLPELATLERLCALEDLWCQEWGSLTYKASYTLMAFRHNSYVPSRSGFVEKTVDWLVSNQREDGSFAPWKSHPVASDTYCTAIALLGMLAYKEMVPCEAIRRATDWLLSTQIGAGIWPFHEIEDGAGWALYALAQVKKTMKDF